MPLGSKGFDNRVRDRLSTLLALRAIPMCVTVDTPSISILLYKRSARVEWITTLRAEEVPSVPLSTARHNDFTFDWCFARLATR
jgi:hypothetical protein